MWRATGALEATVAKRVIPAVENGFVVPTFPSSRLTYLMRDKPCQSLIMSAAEIPSARSYIFFNKKDATEFIRSHRQFPLVAKLGAGFGSNSVTLIKTPEKALQYVAELFDFGITRMYQATGPQYRAPLRRLGQAIEFLRGKSPPNRRDGAYVYFQEFLPGNSFDTRVNVIGSYATAFRRHNRPGDFRASGSGLADHDHTKIDPRIISMAFDVSLKLKCPFVALDFLYRDAEPIVCEINFSYLLSVASRNYSHWTIDPNSAQVNPIWVGEPIDPALKTLTEFLRINSLT